MSRKEKNIELKIYELLGVKTFRKMLFQLLYISIYPFTFKMTKKERRDIFYNYDIRSNYFMKKGHGIQDLKDFKKQLLFNTGVHVLALITCIPNLLRIMGSTASLSATITTLFWVPANIYCIMLQRYNHIRINQAIKKWKPFEETKKGKLKEDLTKENSLLSKHTYKIVNKRNKGKDITFEKLLENATYGQLKQLRNYLSDIKKRNQMIKENPSYYTLNEQSNNGVPLPKNKTLKLEFKL